MSKHVESSVIGNNFKKIAKPFACVQIEIFYNEGNGLHKNGLEKVKQQNDRIRNI